MQITVYIADTASNNPEYVNVSLSRNDALTMRGCLHLECTLSQGKTESKNLKKMNISEELTSFRSNF